ncbi:hypothetical protein [Deinococcus sp. QL22]|uniref:hypothetical protein n=1 Tax=Deinococcus sp. QL22 TaxID=2939437 RepID=UPI0020178B08|nr:hypothetical protein [Deinococcus sp. QL22]UQN08823.1 hypothetical protein M1R55_19655 [Deinococcus sp. QL22]
MERLTEDLCRVLESGIDSDRNPITPEELAQLLALGGGGPAVRAVARRASIWLYYTQPDMAQSARQDARIIAFMTAALAY